MRMTINDASAVLRRHLHDLGSFDVLHLQVHIELHVPALGRHQIHVVDAEQGTCYVAEEKGSLLEIALEQVSMEAREYGLRNTDPHADSSPRKHTPTPVRKVSRLSPVAGSAAGRHVDGCHENQPQFPSIGAGPVLELEFALKAGGIALS